MSKPSTKHVPNGAFCRVWNQHSLVFTSFFCEKSLQNYKEAEQYRMKRRLIWTLLIANLLGFGNAWAEDPAPFPDFTFKRVKIPQSGSSGRITVQIDPSAIPVVVEPKEPEETEETEAPTDIDKESPKPAGLYDWYWELVSPSLVDASSGRFEKAIAKLSAGPNGSSVKTPRLQDMQEIATLYNSEILIATIGTNVSPALVLAVIGIESAGKVNAVSGAGASGLMQLMPATAERFGVKDIKIPAENIKGGVAYLDWLMKEFDNDPILVLASYNAGENAVKRHAGVPPYAETRAYVPKVLAAWTVARGLCLTPPQLVSDGCVFATMEVLKND